MVNLNRVIKIGEIRRYRNTSLIIEVIGRPEAFKVFCKVLEVGPTSKFKVGQEVYLLRRYVWEDRR